MWLNSGSDWQVRTAFGTKRAGPAGQPEGEAGAGSNPVAASDG